MSADWTSEGQRTIGMFKDLQFLIPIPGFLCTPIGKTSLLPQLSQVTKPRGVLKATFMKIWDMVDNINYKPTFLTNAVFQALRRSGAQALRRSGAQAHVEFQESGHRPPSSKQRRDSMAAMTDTRSSRDYSRPLIFQMTELGLSSSRERNQEIGSAIPCPR
jgi:hypothetical protein